MRRRAFLACSGVTLTTLAGCVSQTPRLSATNQSYSEGFTPGSAWSMPGYDAGRRGHNPTASVPEGDIGAAWLRTPIDEQRTNATSSVVTSDTHAFVGSGRGGDTAVRGDRGGFVAAFDGKTGERAWLTSVTPRSVDSQIGGVAYADGLVIVTWVTRDPPSAGLAALTATAGERRWEVELPYVSPRVGKPAVADGRVYVATPQRGVAAVSLDGKRLWLRSVGDDEELVSTTPCLSGASVFVGTDRGRTIALDAADGRQRWQIPVVDDGSRPRLYLPPAAADGTVFVPGAGTASRVYALDSDDGAKLWETRELTPEHRHDSPHVAVAGDTVYGSTIHGGLAAFDGEDGTERWQSADRGGEPPAVGDDLVLAPTDGGTINAYETTGERRWTFETRPFDTDKMGYLMSPSVSLAHSRVYVSLVDGRVYSLGAA